MSSLFYIWPVPKEYATTVIGVQSLVPPLYDFLCTPMTIVLQYDIPIFVSYSQDRFIYEINCQLYH